MTKPKTVKATTIYMPVDLRTQIDRVCKRTGLSMNDIVREATRREIMRLKAEHPAYQKL